MVSHIFICGILEVYISLPGREDAMQEKLSEALSRASRCLGHKSAMKIARCGRRCHGVDVFKKNNKKTMVFLGVSSFPWDIY